MKDTPLNSDKPMQDIDSGGLSLEQMTLWLTLGRAPKRAFPDFNNTAAEVALIKQTLKERAAKAGGHLDFRNGGTFKRDKGLVLISDYEHTGHVPDNDPRRKDSMTANEIESETNASLLE